VGRVSILVAVVVSSVVLPAADRGGAATEAVTGSAPSRGSGTTTAGARGDSTDVYVVHGLNLDFQTSQGDGGTAVTVCSDGVSLVPDLEFGDVAGPLPVASDQDLLIRVYTGAGIDCESTLDAPLIDQVVTPDGDAFAVVATSNGDQVSAELIGGPIDTTCVQQGTGAATIVHAANAGELEVYFPGFGDVFGVLSFDESLSLRLIVDTYQVGMYVPTPNSDPVLAFDLPVRAETVTVAYAVGGQPVDGDTPTVAIVQGIGVEVCDQPAPAASPEAAEPVFTG